MPYGTKRYGDGPYAGTLAEPPPPPIPTRLQLPPLVLRDVIGCGEYTAFLTLRGGGPLLYQIPFTALDFNYQLDDSSSGSISLPTTGHHRSVCCDILNVAEPWKHEVRVFRDGEQVFVGPLLTINVTQDGGRLGFRDLFYWTERRFLSNDAFFADDASTVFRQVFEMAMAPDPSPDIEIIVHEAGIRIERNLLGSEFHRAADLLREFARSAVDFTVIGRKIIVGGKELFDPAVGVGRPLLIHDGGVKSYDISKDGGQFATDVAVFGEAVLQGAENRIVGRAQRSISDYGLVQQSFAELLITDVGTANNNALSRVLQMQPVPVRVNVQLSPDAAFQFKDIIAGRRADVRLSQGCIEVMDIMRCNDVKVNVSRSEATVTEEITLGIVPLGLSEDN